MTNTFLTAMIAAFLTGSIIPLFFYKNNRLNIAIAHLAALIGSVAAMAASATALINLINQSSVNPPTKFLIFPSPIFGSGSLSLDGLSAFFLLTISLVSFAATIYAPAYVAKIVGSRSAAGFGALYNLFLLSLAFVVMLDNAFYFLVFWEIMTLASYFLVVFNYKKIETARAGFQYLVMTHIGTAFILLSFIVLSYSSGSFDFSEFRTGQTHLSPLLKNLVFIASILGFSTKAGLIPLHVWLPRAHPAAPSHISALMSGVMIKTGVYGIIRIAFEFLNPAPWWWGFLILAPAIISAVVGVMYALMEQDLKRMLAFSSVENVGIIMMGVGLSLIFTSVNLPVAAALCMTAALFHLINHALFKGLLFMGAGSIQYSTGLKNIEEMGGLLKLMPITGALFLIGSLAISAMPPLNGFASEWMIFQAILKATLIKDNSIQLLMLISIPALALTSGLAVATFIKAFGISFLAIPRTDKAASAKEVPLSMNLGAGILAGLCVLLGLGSGFFARIPLSVANHLFGYGDNDLNGKALFKVLELKVNPIDLSGISHSMGGLSNNTSQFHAGSSISLIYISIALLLAALLAKLIVRLRGPQSTRTGATWDCGIPEVTPRMQYSALAFSRPLKVVFRAIYRPSRTIEVSDNMSSYYTKSISYRASISHVLEQQVYRRIVGYTLKVAGKARVIQGGNINMYLVYIFVTLIAVILFAWR